MFRSILFVSGATVPQPSRRAVLIGGVTAIVGTMLGARRAMAELSAPKPGATVAIENYSVDGKSLGIVQMSRLAKTDAERRAQLSPLAFQVTRQAGTETPFSGQYAANHAAGLYRCICCDTTLFDSHTKFESGTS